jgi:predicted nucleic acid-binding protein
MPVIDASVYIALINTLEADHAGSWAWFEQALSDQERISAPVILLAEVAAALSRGLGDPTLAHRVVQNLRQSTLVSLAPVTSSLAERAAEIAASQLIGGCDAVYVALAKQLGDTLVTLDRQQLERGAAIVTTHKP